MKKVPQDLAPLLTAIQYKVLTAMQNFRDGISSADFARAFPDICKQPKSALTMLWKYGLLHVERRGHKHIWFAMDLQGKAPKLRAELEAAELSRRAELSRVHALCRESKIAKPLGNVDFGKGFGDMDVPVKRGIPLRITPPGNASYIGCCDDVMGSVGGKRGRPLRA